MDIANIYHCGYHLFTDDHFTTYIASDFALHKGTFITGAMHCNQLKHSPPPTPKKKIVSATPTVGEKIYFNTR